MPWQLWATVGINRKTLKIKIFLACCLKNVKRLFIMKFCNFLIFKTCLRIFVMFLNVGVCDILILSMLQVRVLRLSSLQIFIESLKFWCELLIIVLGCLCMSDDALGV